MRTIWLGPSFCHSGAETQDRGVAEAWLTQAVEALAPMVAEQPNNSIQVKALSCNVEGMYQHDQQMLQFSLDQS